MTCQLLKMIKGIQFAYQAMKFTKKKPRTFLSPMILKKLKIQLKVLIKQLKKKEKIP